MGLQVIGAGVPRSGTTSLKQSLERLLDGPCYHMFEFFSRADEHGVLWWQALEGDLEALDRILDGWTAAVDWPTSIFWRELAERHPDALVVLSHRGSADTWWGSADATVWKAMRRYTSEEPGEMSEGDQLFALFNGLMRRRAGLGDDWDDPAAAMAWYDRHFDEVVATVPSDRLLIWEPSEGWDPLCERLGLPVPPDDPVRANTRAEFVARAEAARKD